jgi:hypothetical protein
MSNQNKDRKISDLIAQTSIPSDAYITYISGNVNYRISLVDFISSIGVTGTIVQDGAVTGTPVLNTTGSVNKIRNIEDGSGIKSSVSPENGITIEHNFIEDTTGVELVSDLTATQPKFRSLVAGSGINVSSSNGQIQIALSAIPASTKTVIVNDINDFPAAVGGIITLADNTEYAVRNDITTANRFVMGNNCVISGADSVVTKLAYTGSGVMFTSVNNSFTIKDIKFDCASGTFLSFSGSGIEIVQLLSVVVIADTMGTFGDFAGVHFDDAQLTATTNGFTFSGSNGVILLEANLITIAAGTMYDLGTATFNGFSITDSFATLNGASVFLSGAAASANINAGSLGTVHNCRFFSTGTPLSVIADNDLRWQFFINDDIDDTHRDCLMSQINNVTETVIAVAGTPVKLAGTWTEEHASHFTTDATGKMTYNGVKDQHVDVTFSFTAAPVSGTNKDIVFYVFKNGVEITNSGAANNLSSGDPGRTTLLWRLNLTATDYIEAFVENNTDTVNVLVTDAILRIS